MFSSLLDPYIKKVLLVEIISLVLNSELNSSSKCRGQSHVYSEICPQDSLLSVYALVGALVFDAEELIGAGPNPALDLHARTSVRHTIMKHVNKRVYMMSYARKDMIVCLVIVAKDCEDSCSCREGDRPKVQTRLESAQHDHVHDGPCYPTAKYIFPASFGHACTSGLCSSVGYLCSKGILFENSLWSVQTWPPARSHFWSSASLHTA